MKAKLKTIILGFILSLSTLLVGQSSTDIELHNRYWTYRENFRKYFTVIDDEPGGGLPFSDIQPSVGADNIKVDAQGNDLKDNHPLPPPMEGNNNPKTI